MLFVKWRMAPRRRRRQERMEELQLELELELTGELRPGWTPKVHIIFQFEMFRVRLCADTWAAEQPSNHSVVATKKVATFVLCSTPNELWPKSCDCFYLPACVCVCGAQLSKYLIAALFLALGCYCWKFANVTFWPIIYVLPFAQQLRLALSLSHSHSTRSLSLCTGYLAAILMCW